MSKHTAGEWDIVEREGYSGDYRPRFIVVAPDIDHRICTVSLRGAPNNDKEISEANARLITAAPQLLELLDEWRHTPYFDNHSDWANWVGDFGIRVDVAIAAVTGGE